MVSFQCDGCSDVIKKPKLDQHYGRCHASVSCIDCSKTFHSPTEFQGHSSCISEAEKYQGDLYRGVRHGDQSWNKNVRGGSRGRFNGRGRGDGRGGFQGRPQGRPYRGSGPNGIELGANVRSFGASPTSSPHSTSPAPNTAEATVKEKAEQDAVDDDKGMKNDKNKETCEAITTNPPSDNPDAVLKKSKKRKATAEPLSEASPSSGGTDPTEPEKKKKKPHTIAKLSSVEAVPPTVVATGEPSPTRKEKSKDKGDKKNKERKTLKSLGDNPETAPGTEKLEKRSKKKHVEKGEAERISNKRSKKLKSLAAES